MVRYNTIQYNMIPYDTIWYDTIPCDRIWYDTIRYDTDTIQIQYDTIRYDTIRYDIIWYSMIHYDMIRYGTIRYDASHCPQRSGCSQRSSLSTTASLLLQSVMTGLPVHHVMTDSSILTGLTGTLINVHLTVGAIEPRWTFTQVHADEVVTAGPIAARAGLTLIYFNFAVDSWWRRKVRM